jgi:uncharacterized protein (TIGR01244 family)
MADIRPVTEDFAVAPQLSPEDLKEVAARGFRLVINNRPDGEAPDQPPSTAMALAAREAGLDYLHIPVAGMAQRGQLEAMVRALKGAEGPALAFCRSGTRSITAWALGEAMAGEKEPPELVRLARAAGYDLGPVFGVR